MTNLEVRVTFVEHAKADEVEYLIARKLVDQKLVTQEDIDSNCARFQLVQKWVSDMYQNQYEYRRFLLQYTKQPNKMSIMPFAEHCVEQMVLQFANQNGL